MKGLCKRSFGLLIGAVCWSYAGKAQQTAPTARPLRRANTVLVLTTMPADPALRRVAPQLERRGYRVHQTPAALQLTTEPGIEAGGKGWPLVMQVSPVEGGLQPTGRCTMPERPGKPELPAEFLGFAWSPAKISFRQVEKTALAVPAATTRYSRK